jgi:hypothetical protein
MAGRKLVLENKLLAIATKHQLEGYHAKLLENQWVSYSAPVTEWRLLTLLPVTFRLPDPWIPVTYGELLPALDETTARLNSTDGVLMSAYTSLVRSLVELTDSLDIVHNLEDTVELDPALTEELRAARLLSLVRKLRISRCASLISERLDSLNLDLPQVKAALTNTEGLMDFFAPGDMGRQFGWQIQGGQVRLAMLTGPHDSKTLDGRNRVASEYRDYFEFDLPKELSALLTPYSGRRDWLGFGHQFVHRYQSLRPGVTWRQLIDLAIHLSQRSAGYAQDRGSDEEL